jgi:hypothetical protein
VILSPTNSRPFLASSGLLTATVTISYVEHDGAVETDISTSGATLVLLNPVAATGFSYYRVKGLPELSALGYRQADLIVAKSSDNSLLYQESISVGDRAGVALVGQVGLQPVTVTVTDSVSSLPIAGATASVWDSALAVQVVPGVLTDVLGRAVLALPTGSYKVLLFRRDSSFANPFALSVSNAPVSAGYTGVVNAVTVPDPGEVTFYGFIQNVDGTPAVGVPVLISLNSVPQFEGGVGFVAESVTATTDLNGFFEVELAASANVTVFVEAIRFQKSGVLPASGRVSLSQLNTDFS